MEVQDIPAIVAAARPHNIPVAIDNTYAAGILFDAFAHGVDVSMQALTKYVGGHSDLLLGTVSVRDEAAMRQVGRIYRLLGLAVSPDDCSLALRGLQTLGIRLKHLEQSTLTIAKWLKARPEISLVLHPALPDCPGHDIWKRDFTGSASVFSIVFNDDRGAPTRIVKFVEALRLFKIGYSWGGVTSLVDGLRVARPRQPQLRPPPGPPQHRPRRTARPHRRPRTSTPTQYLEPCLPSATTPNASSTSTSSAAPRTPPSRPGNIFGKGDKNQADGAASDAMRGMFGLIDFKGLVRIGEGRKDDAPGIFEDEKVGTWREGAIPAAIAVDPIDGTTLTSKGLPGAISVLAVSACASPTDDPRNLFPSIPSHYMEKIAVGQAVAESDVRVQIDAPLEANLSIIAGQLRKRRPRPGGRRARSPAPSSDHRHAPQRRLPRPPDQRRRRGRRHRAEPARFRRRRLRRHRRQPRSRHLRRRHQVPRRPATLPHVAEGRRRTQHAARKQPVHRSRPRAKSGPSK